MSQGLRRRRWGRAGVLAVTAMALASTAAAGGTATGAAQRFTATALQASDTSTVAKSASGRLAESDPAVLARTDKAIVNVVVKLDFDAAASYRGGIKGLAATSPQTTGRKLTGRSAAERAYARYTTRLINVAAAAIRARVPGARIGRSLKLVYGGLAVRLPANQARNLLSIANVTAVQADALAKPLTDASPRFIGAPTIWSQEGGKSLAYGLR